MKKLIIILLLVTSVASLYAQRVTDMHSSQGHFIEYKKSLKKAGITISVVDNFIIVDKVIYYILSYTHTKDDNDNYYTFHTITDGSVKYLIVWDMKHQNILIQKKDTQKPWLR